MSDWAPIEGFEKYSVNSLGQVRHDRTQHLLTPQLTQFGSAYVSMVRETSHQFKRSLALLVARAFIPQPYAAYDTPINLDGDRLNCTVDNLEWRPRWFALKYHKQFKSQLWDVVAAPLRNVDTGEEFLSTMDAAVRYGLLEEDLFLSISNQTVAWPLMHRFEWIE